MHKSLNTLTVIMIFYNFHPRQSDETHNMHEHLFCDWPFYDVSVLSWMLADADVH